ncbi:MAG: transcription termination factor NusA [Chloroflexota bacterium]
MMTKELCYVIDQMSREKGIPRDALLQVLESALFSAARKRFGNKTNVTLRIDPKTCEIQVFETKTVVEEVSNPDEEMALHEARDQYPDKGLGDTIEIPIAFQDFGRIAAQTAKQVIFQKVREAERDIIYEEYKDRIGQVVSGTVLRKEKGSYYVSLGRTEALLPQRETLPSETLRRGDTIKALLLKVETSQKGPVIVLSRTDPNFVICLFKLEVPEIHDGIVEIRGIAREPGERTKISVSSRDSSIDPVGACVGMKGTRVQSIVRELRGERIDIIPWSDDPRVFIARALTPATVDRVGINEEGKTAMVIADDQQLSLAIGRRGQNIKLATKLTGWEIDILSESEYSKMKMEEAERTLEESLKKEMRGAEAEEKH